MTNEPRFYKRYNNRKLYDVELGNYVTLNDVANVIKAGEKIRVIDNRSKQDITTHLLAQIVSLNTKPAKEDNELLYRIIETYDGDYMSYIKSLEERKVI